ncbi:MAG TPA: hypothetical protein VI685_04500, partial [Candidatus Angelobacter sp.]
MSDDPKESTKKPSAGEAPVPRSSPSDDSGKAKPDQSTASGAAPLDVKEKAVPFQDGGQEPKATTNVETQVDAKGNRGTINVTGVKNQTRKIFVESGSTKPFSRRMAAAIPWDKEKTQKHIHDELVISRFVSALQKTRMLIIAAEPDSGKGATAMYLAFRLMLSDSALKENELTQVPPLDAPVFISLIEIARNKKEFGNQVIFFKDFFDHQNRSLREFLTVLDESLIRSLSRDLEASGAYLIFTADQHSLEDLNSKLQALNICVALPLLNNEKLGQGLDAALERSGGEGAKLTPEQREEILARAKTIPRIVRFVESDLTAVVQGELSVEQAFAKMDQISLRMRYLTEDFETWSFTFVLGLVQSVSASAAVPWTE